MTVSVTTEPTYVMPGKPTEVRATCSAGNMVRVVLTAAPEASALTKKMRDEDLSELQLWTAESGERYRYTFDVPGSYVCTIREYTKGGVAFGGDHQGDPDGYPSETAVGSTAHTFKVGQRLTAQVRYGQESGTLTLWVWDSTIRETTVPTHGERSPRFDAATPLMKTAASDANVNAAVAALINASASTVMTSLGTVVDNIITKFNLHISRTSNHSAADSANTIAAEFSGASTVEGLRNSLTNVTKFLRNHYTNDAGTGFGIGSGSYHSKADWDNLPLANSASDLLGASLAVASIWHSYEAHRQDTGVHTTTGSDSLSALPTLLNVYQKIVAVLANDNPTAPSNDNPGATLLVHRGGLTKS